MSDDRERHCVIGIDPGVTGALALLTFHGELIDAADMPNDGHGRVTTPLVVAVLHDWCWHQRVECAVVENVGSMPGQGVSTTFKFGRATGVAETLPLLFDLPTYLITPATWKKHLGLTRQDKDSSRQMAIRLWPNQAATIFKTKASGQARADAALLALAWIQRRERVPA